MSFVDTFVKNHPVQKFEVDDVVGEYIVGGNGKIGFLIFPGGGQDALSCYDLIDSFEKKYKVIAVNFAGFSTLSALFEFINKIFEKEKIEKVVVYGLSLGGFFAQHYALNNPEKINKIILCQATSAKSKITKERIIIPGKILHFILPVIPMSLLKWVVKKFAGREQAGRTNIKDLYKKYSTKENLKRRIEFGRRFGLDFLTREFLDSFYKLGMEMVEKEKEWDIKKLNQVSRKMLIIKTDNDPLAQDDGIFAKYYPHARMHIFHETGHLTPFIQFENMVTIIKEFLK